MKILLVDDDPQIRKIAQICLQKVGGWEVSIARSGSEALNLAQTESPDIILLDIMMPGMDGPTTLLCLRQIECTKEVPIIFFTANARSSDSGAYEGLGALGVIGKPFDPMTLHKEIQELIAI